MEWKNLISSKRYGIKVLSHEREYARSEFEKDWDRIIFLSSFRRMQDKTQVFPLPGKHMVHNRLTHSLEVASVGRSLGKIVGVELEKKHRREWKKYKISPTDIAQIVACACLCHDIGNPPFGHSGEDAISNYYRNHKGGIPDLTCKITEDQWKDLDNFEGNANGFRILTNNSPGGIEGGMRLTYSTLATYMKYPQNSLALINKNSASEKKYGFFLSEEPAFITIAQELKLKRKKGGTRFCRHPLSFLMEAADDICNKFLDIEDAAKLNIISIEEYNRLVFPIVKADFESGKYNLNVYKRIKKNDENEFLSYLRSRAINTLIYEVANVFIKNEDQILNGNYDKPLIEDILPDLLIYLNIIERKKKQRIYTNRSVLEIETAGYEVLGGLIEILIKELLINKGSNYSNKLKSLIPKQFLIGDSISFSNVMLINDFVSGMTDLFAVDLYRIIKGISLPNNY